LIYGGSNKSEGIKELFIYDSDINSWSIIEPAASVSFLFDRSRHTLNKCEDGSYIVFGGLAEGMRVNDIIRFKACSTSVSVDDYIMVSNGPSERTGASSVSYREKLFIYGGQGRSQKLNDIWEYDMPGDAWKQLS